MAGRWDEWIGRTASASDTVSASAVARLRATLNLPPDKGNVAPPGFHWCLCLPDTPTAELDVDGHPRRGDFLPPIPLPRRMWVASDVAFSAPILLGASVERHSTIVSVSEKQGSTGLLAFVEIDHLTIAGGEEAVRERQTIVYREQAPAAVEAPATVTAPTPVAADQSDWQWRRTVETSEPLLFRYSALTFNSHRIHYDRPYATAVEQYPGLVVHGPLTATLLIDLAIRHLAQGVELAGFVFRARAPAFAGERLELVGTAGGPERLELAALGGDGRTIMSASATVRPRC